VAGARSREVPLSEPEGFESATGRGIRATLQGRAVLVGSPALLAGAGVDTAALEEAAAMALSSPSVVSHANRLRRFRPGPLVEEGARPAGEPMVEVGAAAAERAVDPVCGMEVDPANATTVSVDGATHYFCSTGCREHFLSEEHHPSA
jgi:Cu+-exporting ATPase